MLSLTRRLRALSSSPCSQSLLSRSFRTESEPSPRQRRRQSRPPAFAATVDEKTEWWAVDGEMHEVGDNVPHRERFVVPSRNISNRRRKVLRDQFMRRTRLLLKETEHEPWCKRYMELYQELRENWERLYWDEGYSKQIARDHTNYDSAEDEDFSPYRNRQYGFDQSQNQGFRRNAQDGDLEKVSLIRDKFEYDRDRRLRETAFAPIHEDPDSVSQNPNYRRQQTSFAPQNPSYRPQRTSFVPYNSNYRPQRTPFTSQNPNYRPQEAPFASQNPNYRPQEAPFASQNPNYRPQEAPFASQNPNYRPQQMPFASQNPNYRPQQTPFASQNPNYRPQETSFRTQQTDVQQPQTYYSGSDSD